MARTRTPGITVDCNGDLAINKEYRGKRLFVRLAHLSQEEAEARLHHELERLDVEIERRAHARPLFRNCAARYLAESRKRRTFVTIEFHVQLLNSYYGDVEPHKIHDATLAPFISDRVAAGASATTINRSLEVVRTILHRSARAYRDEEGRPWLDGVPPLITMLPESPWQPYPITLGGTGSAFSAVARSPCQDGVVRRQHGLTR